MQGIDVLYDHYKETFKLSKIMRKTMDSLS